jgi:transposase
MNSRILNGLLSGRFRRKPRGIPRVDDRRLLNGIFWALRSSAPLARPAGVLWLCASISTEPASWTTSSKYGPSRGGLTRKIDAVVDTNSLPVYLAHTPGEAHDNRLCSVLLSALLPQTMVLPDRGYDADWIRELVRQQGAWANIPPKRYRKDPICFSLICMMHATCRTVLQQDQAVSACRDPIRQTRS